MPVMAGLPLWTMCFSQIIDSSDEGSSLIFWDFPSNFPMKVIESSSVPSAPVSPVSPGISAEKPDEWELLLKHVHGANNFSLPGKLQARISLLSCEFGGVMLTWPSTSSSLPSSGSPSATSSSSSPSAPESSLTRGGEGGRVRDCSLDTLSASTGLLATFAQLYIGGI